jgi:hypothetical protein
MKEAEGFLREKTIIRYWTRPKSPKEKPFVEGIIGAFPRESLDYHYQPMHVRELAEVVDFCLDKAPAAKTGVFDVDDPFTAPMNC